MPPKKRATNKFSRKALLDALRQAGAPLRSKNIYGLFDADASLKKVIKSTLAQMVESGEIAQMGKSYGLLDSLPRMTGTLDVRRSGVGYLISDDRRQKDLFIHPSNFGGAWPGDRVTAVVDTGRKKDAPEGRIVEILERGVAELMVRVSRRISGDSFFCHPTDARMPFYTVVDTSDIPTPEKGDILSVRPEEEQEKGLWRCTALRRLGEERDLATQELLVKTSYSIPEEFPTPVLRQAEALPAEPSPADWAGRTDLRGVALVTIDGETAKDFDDAVYVERQENGYRLVVAIADVAHYVPENSALDVEARVRGNSYYFPLSVEPMFPEALSNGLCSLRPHVPRLAMVVDTPYSLDGEPGKPRLYNAVIESQARLTYNQVQAALDGSPDTNTEPLMPMLRDAEALAQLFLKRRTERGCLDFDIPEAQVRLVEDIVSVHAGTRLFSHRLIEEFMIAANERVAEYLGARERVFPYRIHPQPDERKLETLRNLLAHTSLVDRLPKDLDQKGLQSLTHAADGTDMEFLVNRLVLRTMMQAQYSPDNGGHYGLASEAYCHFTSPIRRYADLLVHRSLKRLLAGEAESMDMDEVQGICEGLNSLERKAMEAEREIQKRASILALEDRVGETMRGVISGVADFGFWVELLDMPVDGLVRLATLDDYYVYDPERQDLLGQRTGKTFSMGQTLDVVLDVVSLERVEINFTLA
ncbi:ribonuclease R [Desulfomicrobium escambiense]|uniref:ribonuclease R n=1 Tax=Desulfomicrobium escambiense TaxID=29503 RepID=UPI0003FA86A4|nr:ribonuclease R [Desulfomicrobium escambiense]